MDYFGKLQQLLQLEREADRRAFEALTARSSINERKENGTTWFPIAIRDTEIGKGDYLTIELERTGGTDLAHLFRNGMSASFFSAHDPGQDRLEGVIVYLSGNRMKLALRVDELPDWTRRGKLGVDAVFDEGSYSEMEGALQHAAKLLEKKEEGRLARVLTASDRPGFEPLHYNVAPSGLNESQALAVQRILEATELAIVHGPPGTGKTTTLVEAIAQLVTKRGEQVLVTAPSNAAVDLLSERLSKRGLNVVRVGNPARVSEAQLSLTLDQKMSGHASMKEIKRMRKQAAEYRDLAQKYKRSFGPAEREQRKALFAEARNISREVEKTEQYIADDILDKAQVITATLVGARHYSIRSRSFATAVIDEAGQALEPACWIPAAKCRRLILAGDHLQLPPTIKSDEAFKGGLAQTLLEKLVQAHPEAVVLLEEQYRMHQQIMEFSSQQFYGGQLRADESVREKQLASDEQPLLFIDTAGCGYEELREGSGISNVEEAGLLVRHLEHLLVKLSSDGLATPSVGVISPYRHQVAVLKEMVEQRETLKSFLSSITVNTIDSFQGSERDVIYISLTRSNAENSIGFLSEIRRMNVAMTRARQKLVILGDSATLSHFPFYAAFIQYAEQLGAYVSAWELMDL